MQDSPAVAQARAIYEQLQDDCLASSPLAEMAAWVATGAAPSARVLRDQGLTTAGPADPQELQLARKAFVRHWGYSIPCAEAVAALGAIGPMVEVGAGSAYWSALLSAAGVDMVATDAAAGRTGYGFEVGRCFATERLTASDAVLKYPDRALFCSWPTKGEDWAAEAASLMHPGRPVAMILDERPGVTGGPGLAAFLSEQCQLLQTVVMPQFPRQQDRLLIHRRR